MLHIFPCAHVHVYIFIYNSFVHKDEIILGHLGGSVVERLPSAQGVILGARIEPHITLPAWTLLLPLPVSLPLSVSLMNK